MELPAPLDKYFRNKAKYFGTTKGTKGNKRESSWKPTSDFRLPKSHFILILASCVPPLTGFCGLLCLKIYLFPVKEFN